MSTSEQRASRSVPRPIVLVGYQSTRKLSAKTQNLAHRFAVTPPPIQDASTGVQSAESSPLFDFSVSSALKRRHMRPGSHDDNSSWWNDLFCGGGTSNGSSSQSSWCTERDTDRSAHVRHVERPRSDCFGFCESGEDRREEAGFGTDANPAAVRSIPFCQLLFHVYRTLRGSVPAAWRGAAEATAGADAAASVHRPAARGDSNRQQTCGADGCAGPTLLHRHGALLLAASSCCLSRDACDTRCR
eukprot:2807153-Rhodomonas_salina.1